MLAGVCMFIGIVRLFALALILWVVILTWVCGVWCNNFVVYVCVATGIGLLLLFSWGLMFTILFCFGICFVVVDLWLLFGWYIWVGDLFPFDWCDGFIILWLNRFYIDAVIAVCLGLVVVVLFWFLFCSFGICIYVWCFGFWFMVCVIDWICHLLCSLFC